jgi:hypothetical protein
LQHTEGQTCSYHLRRYGSSVTNGSSAELLPGEDLVREGLADLQRGVESVESLLVSIGAPRLRRLEISVPEPLPEPHSRLYELLSERHGDAAHSRYNALIRRLVSFERSRAIRSLRDA